MPVLLNQTRKDGEKAILYVSYPGHRKVVIYIITDEVWKWGEMQTGGTAGLRRFLISATKFSWRSVTNGALQRVDLEANVVKYFD